MITLSRRPLQCLDEFLGGKNVWVFSTSQDYSDRNTRLHLITKVDTFADIWGPLWKECPVGIPAQVIRYKVGHGAIVPWTSDQEMNLHFGEVYCHGLVESDVLKGSLSSMLEYLRPYPWLDADCKNRYTEVVGDKDLKAFRPFWQSHPQWHGDIRKAVCCCLRALSETGVGIKEELDALYVIWAPAAGQRHLVMLREPKHKWVGFLKDSRDYFTMAVVTSECLDFTGDGGKCCGIDGYSVFETQLIINDGIKPIHLRKLRVEREEGAQEYCWRVSQLRRGESFPLGDRGALEFIKRIGRGSILVKWKAAILRQAKLRSRKVSLADRIKGIANISRMMKSLTH